ncbi:MAG: lytic transglycosylase domain-containing protein [Paracoccaceae bacterium]
MQAASRLPALILALLLAMLAAAGGAQQPPRPLGQAMEALREGDWQLATRLALRDGPEAADVVEWHRLRAGRGSAAEVMAFLARNPDWPGLPWLRRHSETAIAKADDRTILDFFAEAPPQTGTGALAHASALMATGETGAAQAGIVLAWRTMPLSSAEHAAFLTHHAPLLAPHHPARLDRMLWAGWADDAEAMLPLVSEEWRALAAARRALSQDRPGVDSLIARVPEALRDHPGLAYERFAWRARRGRTEAAIELMLDRSETAERLGRPAAWAPLRRSLARSLMRQGDLARAHALASSHHTLPEDGYAHSDLEWLSGYLALRLGRPEAAAAHFRRFDATVASPISRGRAGYWLGRALEAAGQDEAARAAYARGARYQSSFYGLLAAERAGLPFDAELAGEPDSIGWRDAAFTESSVYRAGVLLLASGELSLGERFLTHLAESLDEQDLNRLGAMLEDIGQPHVAVMVGKRAATAGLTIPVPYFALHPMAQAPSVAST